MKTSQYRKPSIFFNSMTTIRNTHKISFKSADDVIDDIKYITMKSLDNKNIDSANSLYLIFNNVDGYIKRNSIEESNENK